MSRRLLLTVLCSALLLTVTVPTAYADPLRNHAAARGLLVGTALATGPLAGEPAYRDTANREFNVVTAENAMKWDATEPSRNQFTFAGADQIVASAQANGQAVHGHTLVWHSQTPSWVQSLNQTEMLAAMRNHISTVVGRYAGRVRSWDVVNEALNEDGTLRNSFWRNTLGDGYIASAFRYARAADAAAELCINDYNTDGLGAKSDGMFRLVQSLLQQGVPVTCVGFQAHLAIQYGFPNQMQQNLQRFADLGLTVKVTELDVRMQLPVDANKLTTQATYYRNVVNACLAVARCNQLTIWGFTDKYSWVESTFPGEGAALPYDANYQPKPAYTAIHDALAGSSGGGTCDVDYRASNWGGSNGFTANVTITNTGTSPVNGWTLAFTFTAGQRLTQPGWSAQWTQGNAAVTATNLTWNASIAPNASISVGFNGTHTGSNPAPATFTLNGTTCST